MRARCSAWPKRATSRAASEIFLPYLSGERTPHNDPNAQGVLFGLTPRDRCRRAIAQAVLEGVAFAFRDGMDALLASGAKIESISVIGGGARSQYWGKILSSVLRRPLTYRDSGAVGPAYGAARLARMGAEKASIEDVCTPPPILHVAEPDERLADLYTQRMRPLSRPVPKSQRAYFRRHALEALIFRRHRSDNLRRAAIDKIRWPIATTTRSASSLGKTMEQHLRMAVCYWHTLQLGRNRYVRRRHVPSSLARRPARSGRGRSQARRSVRVLHDAWGCPTSASTTSTSWPRRTTSASTWRILRTSSTRFGAKMSETGVKLLWGTANLFSHPRYMAGGATNPDPDVFRFAATQVRHCLEATHRLGGENYVLWGGREGYDTLLNTNLRQEKNQLGRFLSMVVEHKHKIGFKGAILIEPKPHEPTKHQYDFDVDTIYGFLKHHGLEKEVKVNIESNHATLSGHSFEHEIAMAIDYGIFGSIDMNRGDPQNGWDTDQFPNDMREITLALYYVLQGRRLHHRRQ